MAAYDMYDLESSPLDSIPSLSISVDNDKLRCEKLDPLLGFSDYPTEAQCPPMFSIIAPTPRAFSFPTTVLSDSPYSSRGNSPSLSDEYTAFDFPYAFPAVPPAYGSPVSATSDSQTLYSPDSAASYRSLSPLSSPRRSRSMSDRKSSLGNVDSSPRPRKGDADYVKRPENAFILFRRKCCEERQADYGSSPSRPGSAMSMNSGSSVDDVTAAVKRPRQADLSKAISEQWKALGPIEKAYWEGMAKQKKKEHAEMYPGYVYRPQRSKAKAEPKSRRSVSSAAKRDKRDDELKPLSYTLLKHRQLEAQSQARPASAPLPPYGNRSITIEIPSLYPVNAGRTSPPVLPRISRRSYSPLEHEYAEPSPQSSQSSGTYAESFGASEYSNPFTPHSSLSESTDWNASIASSMWACSEPAGTNDGLLFHNNDINDASSWFPHKNYDNNSSSSWFPDCTIMTDSSGSPAIDPVSSAHSSPTPFNGSASSLSLSHALDDFDMDSIPPIALEGLSASFDTEI